VEDDVVGFPASVTAGVPFIRIMSCNPLEVRAEDLPPALRDRPPGSALLHLSLGALGSEFSPPQGGAN
jgi:hypothetical protein